VIGSPKEEISAIFNVPPFSLDAPARSIVHARTLAALTSYHAGRSPEFKRIVNLLGFKASPAPSIEDIPYIPVRVFKEYELLSVDRSDVVKVITSSGTTGQAVSRIMLDRETATNQTRALVQIVSSFIGHKRLPFLIVDSPAVVKDRALFSARGAAILGFAMLGHDPTYLLDDEYRIDFDRLDQFIQKHAASKVLVFGFTFMIWQHLCQALEKAGRKLELDGYLIHGGGWKKLTSIAVENVAFKSAVAETTGIRNISNYYGMVEQTGSIFMECAEGVLHTSNYSDIIIRDPLTFSSLDIGEVGLIQCVSVLPTSYPGHSILTEDMGQILGIDDCPCGRFGKYFRVLGRIKDAEMRGCSDVYTTRS
jgi:hypothetical protein